MFTIDGIGLGESVHSIVEKGWKSVGKELRAQVESEGWESLDAYYAQKIQTEGWAEADSLYYKVCKDSGLQSGATLANGLVVKLCGCCFAMNGELLYRTGDHWTGPFSKLELEKPDLHEPTFCYKETSLGLELVVRNGLIVESTLRKPE